MDSIATNDHPYQLGQVVRFRSGGPQMTVIGKGANKMPNGDLLDLVTCAWTDKNDALQIGTVPIQCVALIQ